MKSKKLFTLVEVLIAIFILGVLATVAGIYYAKWLVISRNSSRIGLLRDIQKDLGLYFSEYWEYPEPDLGVRIGKDIPGSGAYRCIQGVLWGGVTSKLETVKSIPLDPWDRTMMPYLVCEFWRWRYVVELATFLENPEAEIIKGSFEGRIPYPSRLTSRWNVANKMAYPLILMYDGKELVNSMLLWTWWWVVTNIFQRDKKYVPPFTIWGGVKLGGEEYRVLREIERVEGDLAEATGIDPTKLKQIIPQPPAEE